MVSDNPGDSLQVRKQTTKGHTVDVSSIVEDVIKCKWSLRLLQLCAEDYSRPSEFLRKNPGLSAKVMNERLRKMVRFGILKRYVFGDKPPIRVEYRLTQFGRYFIKIIEEIRNLQDLIDRGAIEIEAPDKLK